MSIPRQSTAIRAAKNKAIRQENTREMLANKGLIQQVIVITDKLEDGNEDIDSTMTQRLRAAADLKMRLVDKYLPSLKAIETTSNDVQDLSAFLMQAADIAKKLQETAEGKEKLAAARKAAKPVKPSDTTILRGKPGEAPPKPGDGAQTLN